MAVLGHIWRIVARISLLRSKGSRIRVAPRVPSSGGEPKENSLSGGMGVFVLASNALGGRYDGIIGIAGRIVCKQVVVLKKH